MESVVDELADKLGIDPIEFRLKNAVEGGHARRPTVRSSAPIGFIETLEADQGLTRTSPHRSGKNQGRGVAAGFWFNIGGETTVNMQLNEDGTVTLMAGTPDIGGLRASLAMMAAEELGIDYKKVRPIIATRRRSASTSSPAAAAPRSRAAWRRWTPAARSSSGPASARPRLWEVPVDAVEWVNGQVQPGRRQRRQAQPMTLADIAKGWAGKTGGPIVGVRPRSTPAGCGAGFATHIVDVEVDPETGHTSVVRYTTAQDAGRAIHPSYVEGQLQGGVVQGIGWALNEEYIYGADGKMQNPGFLDYRIPVASDLPMIDTVIVEVPNPGHPYGVRGAGAGLRHGGEG